MNLRKKAIDSYPTFFVVVFYSYFFIKTYSVPLFHTNDDFFLYAISSGITYGDPKVDLIFISPPLNYALYALHTLLPMLNWYTIALAATTFISLVLANLFIISKIKINYFKLLASLILFSITFVFSEVLFLLQFTQAAILATFVGFIFLAYSESKFVNLVGILFLILGFSWRPEAALLSGLILIAYYISTSIINRKNSILVQIKKLVPFIAGLIPLGLYNFFKRSGLAFWQDSAERSFQKLNFTRGQLHDATLPGVNWNVNAARKNAGLTKNDYGLFEKFYFADSDIYSQEKLEILANSRPTIFSRPDSLFFNFSEFYTFLLDTYRIELVFLLVIALTISYIFAKNIYKNFLLFLFFSIGSFYLIFLIGKLPARIFWPMSILLLLFLFISSLEDTDLEVYKDRITKISSAVLAGLLFIFSIFIAREIYQKHDRDQWFKEVREGKVKGFERVLEFDSDKPIVAFSKFYTPLIMTLDPYKVNFLNIDPIFKEIIYINWAMRSPDYLSHLTKIGLEDDLFLEVAKGNAYLGIGEIEEIQLVNQYLIEHYQIEPVWDVAPFVFSDTGLGIWKILEVKPIAK